MHQILVKSPLSLCDFAPSHMLPLSFSFPLSPPPLLHPCFPAFRNAPCCASLIMTISHFRVLSQSYSAIRSHQGHYIPFPLPLHIRLHYYSSSSDYYLISPFFRHELSYLFIDIMMKVASNCKRMNLEHRMCPLSLHCIKFQLFKKRGKTLLIIAARTGLSFLKPNNHAVGFATFFSREKSSSTLQFYELWMRSVECVMFWQLDD